MSGIGQVALFYGSRVIVLHYSYRGKTVEEDSEEEMHSSAVSYGCKCSKGFAGSKCEFPLKLGE
ncbi:hypothetical protein RUM44_007926 [Polyplax serrata]|uniref:EGF-like domain-containing protein n=1 Tax=Polyplax serrata TaxID=468196 RepID=A0ABR1B7F3_POLSC